MAKGVTLKQLAQWLENNKKHTWSLRKMAGWKNDSSHLIKYLDVGFDTRRMDIYSIGVRGMCKPFMVHVSDDMEDPNRDNQTILDLLDKKITKELNKREVNNV